MTAREIVFDYFENNYPNAGGVDEYFYSLMEYLNTDTLVSWFFDQGLDMELDEEQYEIVSKYHDMHCGR